MKKISWFLFVIGLVFIVNACQKEPFLQLRSPSSITFTDQGGTQNISMTTNRSWTVSSSESWCKVSPASGEASESGVSIMVTCEPNTTYDSRSCTVTINAGGLMEIVTIEQAQQAVLNLDSHLATISYKGGNVAITINSNVDYSINSPASWVKIIQTKTVESKSIHLSIEENNTYEERTATISINQMAGSIQEVFIITQEPKPAINLSENGTANSYIVKLTEDKYCFRADIKGNSLLPIVGAVKAKIVWQSDNPTRPTNSAIIHSVKFDKSNSTISFYPTKKTGSALVAVTDSTGNILWSWHLWVTNYDPQVDFITYKSGAILQDRYLGAVSKSSAGYYYQWGRKDPLHSSTTNSIMPASHENSTVEYSIKHPEKLMDNQYDITNGDWNREHTSYWSSKKTISDPCPPGWKIADGNPDYLSGWPSDYTAHVIDNNKIRITTPLCEPDDDYFFSGSISNFFEEGVMRMWTNYGYLYGFYVGRQFMHTSFDTDMNYSYYRLSLYGGGMARSIGANVRCQKE